MKSKARILTFDLETAPATAWVFQLKDQNISIDQVKYDAYCLMWAAKWLGDDKVMSDKLTNYPHRFHKCKRDDKGIAVSLRKLLDEADIVVTQNGDQFDIKWAQQLFLKHDIEKPSPFHSIDLLKHSRRDYYSISHKLDFRGRQLLLGSKTPHAGFKLWIGCMNGDKASWDLMEEYCKNDVKLTEAYYLKLRSRIRNHPNVNMFHEPGTGGRLKCPACGSSKLKMKGWRYWLIGRKRRFQCAECKHYTCQVGKADTTTKVAMKSEG